MENYLRNFNHWLNNKNLQDELKKELRSIEGNEDEIKDRFYHNLSFGTGGIRGLLGAGTNRVNLYTIRLIAEGLALYVKTSGTEAMQQGIVIAYDTRHFSKEFAHETAKVLGKHKIQVYLFTESRPTPQLSFAIRHLKAFAGVVITASHNPASYNGFKVYGEDGGQLSPELADKIEQFMETVDDLHSIGIEEEFELSEKGLIHFVLDEIDSAYQERLIALREDPSVIHRFGQELSIVYTPLHGSGLIPVVDGLKAFGFQNIHIVEEQAEPDPNFPTVQTPNPESHEAFELAIDMGSKKNADLLIATDPDADRLGVVVRNKKGEYVQLSGNQLGSLLLHYILLQKTSKDELPHNGILLKSIVTSDMGRAIAKKFSVQTMETLTGFKFISEKIEEFSQTGRHTFLFGYEESCGYLIGDFTRDKDAVQAALLTTEMASYYKAIDKTLVCALDDLYEELGHYRESVVSLQMEGLDGQLQIQQIMEELRNEPPSLSVPLLAIDDYEEQKRYIANGGIEPMMFPISNVLKFHLAGDSWVCARPSGTEPTIKIYFGVKKETSKEASLAIKTLQDEVLWYLESLYVNPLELFIP